jgi:hypothetical protein
MILDSGIAIIYRVANIAEPGEMPVEGTAEVYRSYFSELDFETSPARPTANRKETQTDLRIRIIQNRKIRNEMRVALITEDGQTKPKYEITRAYHGTDDESGELITDLNLKEVSP